MEKNITTETQRHRDDRLRNTECVLPFYHPVTPSPFLPVFFALFLCVSVVNLSCGSKPTDLRTVMPGDALVYLETNDLGEALKAVTDNDAFKAAAKSVPDLSALNGMKLSVAVTGFQTTEQPVTEENSVLNFKPRFVAVVETNAWNYQALSFTENKLGEFINETYGGEVTLETSDKNGGKYFVWTAQDGRKAFALVRGSLIFFGNDESAIDKCLAVTRGESDSIAKNSKIAELPTDSLASGYVSTDGVAQIANIVGLKFAREAGEDSEVQSAIAGVLPQLLRNSITEIRWTATKSEKGIEDVYLISMPSEIARVLNETMAPSDQPDMSLLDYLPPDIPTATLYNLKDPQVAWRSALLAAQKETDPITGKMIAAFATLMFQPYGIRDPELFLKSVGKTIVTAKADDNGDEPVVIASIRNIDGVKRSVSPDVENIKDDSFLSQSLYLNDVVGVSYFGNRVHLGSANRIVECIVQETNRPTERQTKVRKRFGEIKTSFVTVGSDNSLSGEIVSILDDKRSVKAVTTYTTETRFTRAGIERRTVSDFGLIGSIIAQLRKDN